MKSPYPKPQVEASNLDYAYILLQDYAGQISEATATHLYIYQHILKDQCDSEFADIMKQIAIVEMHHLSLLGETIRLLGVNPEYRIFTSDGEAEYWSASYVTYVTDKKTMLEVNIASEQIAINTYKKHYEEIEDVYVRNLIARILEDEYIHLRIFQELYQKESQL